ncbi:MAG: ABC transporter permease [Planctomycetota bacterium]|nr:ABC transporter permease [Planctomycetota bacterium]
MSLWKIAWRSIQQRGLASALTALSMALGVLLVVAVLTIHGVVSQSFKNNSSLGYNLIVGAKGGKLQLTLNTVYYLSQPVENIPYEYYLEFTGGDERKQGLEHSIRAHVNDAQWDAIEAASLLETNGLAGIGGLLASGSLQVADVKDLDLERRGKFGNYTALAIPLCLGDYFGQFRVVGTTPDLFNKLTFGPYDDKTYEFAQGRNFETWNEEHEYFEAVVGATVAREMNVKLGQGISPAHGDPEGEGHERQFTVVGILKPNGTPNDRAVFINMEGFYLMEDHAKPLPKDEEEEQPTTDSAETAGEGVEPESPHDHTDHEHAPQEPLPVEQREVTAILLRTVESNPFIAYRLPTIINEGPVAQCVLPIREITNLFSFIVAPIQAALLGITALVCLVSGISILVSIYNSMSDRKHDIAVMRALGASRITVMRVVLFEAILLSVGGGGVGWVLAHATIGLASPIVAANTGVVIDFWDLAPPQSLMMQLIMLFSVAGFLIATACLMTIVWQVWTHTRVGGFLLFVLLCAVHVTGVIAVVNKSALMGACVIALSAVFFVLLILSAVRWRDVRPAFWCLLFGRGIEEFMWLSWVFSSHLPSPDVLISPEFVLIPALSMLGVAVGILPAVAAYNTDVAESLS